MMHRAGERVDYVVTFLEMDGRRIARLRVAGTDRQRESVADGSGD